MASRVPLVDHARRARARLAFMLRERGAMDIVEAALLVAAEEYPDLDIARERARVALIAGEAARRAAGLENPFARLDAVRTLLAEELGFRGDTEDYYDARNCFLNEVLERRVGIPLTLALVYLEAGRAAGFETRGVALPGHFVVRFDYAGRALLLDPFHRGALISEEDCRELVRRATGQPELFHRGLLAGASPREILGRLLRNLKRIYLARQDYRRALGAVERLLLIDPEEPTELRDRGFLLAHLDRPSAALEALEGYLERMPDAPDAAAVRGRIAWLRRRLLDVH